MDSLLVSMHRLNHLLGLSGSPGWARLFVLWGEPGAVCSGGAESQEKEAEVALLCSAGTDGPADPVAFSSAGSGGIGTECFVGSAGMW